MARAKNKEELINSANNNFDKMCNLIDSMKEIELSTVFNFSDDKNKKEAHWNRDKNIRDLLIHLYEWHQLLINWITNNKEGNNKAFLPEPYNWKTYGELNVKFWEKHQNTLLEKSKVMINESHREVMQFIEKFTDEELFKKKYFSWTGTTNLGSYCISATVSHYDWAVKKIKAHIKNVKKLSGDNK